MASLTAKSKQELESRGILVDTVERYVAAIGRKFDLFGVIDLIAIDDTVTYGIQVTSFSNKSSRKKKIAESTEARRWCLAPGRQLWLMTWGKRIRTDARGAKRRMWAYEVNRIQFNGDQVISTKESLCGPV